MYRIRYLYWTTVTSECLRPQCATARLRVSPSQFHLREIFFISSNMRVELLLKTESGYLRDAEVT